MEVELLVAVYGKLNIVARLRDKKVKPGFELSLFVLEDKHALWRQFGGVESVSGASVIVAKIHYRVLTSIDEEGESVPFVWIFLFRR